MVINLILVAVVEENKDPGFYIIWVKATDEDFDLNGKTDLSISPSNIFDINTTNGVIVTRRAFDREHQKYYKLKVTACDRGSPIR